MVLVDEHKTLRLLEQELRVRLAVSVSNQVTLWQKIFTKRVQVQSSTLVHQQVNFFTNILRAIKRLP